MPTFKRFEDIVAWQKARTLCKDIQLIILETGLLRDYKLRDQINGSSGSIMDNIAEGFGRGNVEFLQFLEISFGSACECQSQFYRIFDRKYITKEKFNFRYNCVEEIKRMLLSLIGYLSKCGFKGAKYKLRETNET